VGVGLEVALPGIGQSRNAAILNISVIVSQPVRSRRLSK
jgi:hypothetical protein